MLRKMLCFLFCLNTFSASDPAELLLSSFRSLCPNVVSFSSSSTSLLSNYRDVLLELKQRDKCYGASSNLSSLESFSKSFSQYEIYRSTKIEKEQKERLVADYSFYLSSNQVNLSTETVEFLESEILKNQAEIIATNSEITRFESMGQGFEQGSGNFLNSFNDLLSSLDGSNQCISKTDSLYGSLLGNGLSIASIGASPASSLYLSLAGSVVKSVSDYMYDAKYTKLLNEVDSILWPEAIRCVSEAMTKNYCGALQTSKLIQSHLDDQAGDKVIFEGIELLNYDMRGLDDWLVQVYAGSPFTTQGDLSDRDKYRKQADLLQTISRVASVYKTNKDIDMEPITDLNLLSNAVYASIVGLQQILERPQNLFPSGQEGGYYSSDSSTDVANPIYNVRTSTLVIFQLYGLDEIPNDCELSGTTGTCPSFKLYIEQRGIKLTMNDWLRAYSKSIEIVSDTLRQVNITRARVDSFDPIGLFMMANRKFSNKPNALEGIKSIINNTSRISAYISEVACKEEPGFCDDEGSPTWMNSYSTKIDYINDILEISQTISRLIYEVSNPRSILDAELPVKCQKSNDIAGSFLISDERKEKAFIIGNCISDLLELSKRGNDIYFSKIRNMVSIELETKLSRNELASDVADVLRATRDDLVERLTLNFTRNSNATFGQILTGLESSRDITQKTMDSFFDVFKKPLIKAIEDPSNSSRVKSELCFRVLPFMNGIDTSNLDLKKIYSECKNEEMQEYKGVPKLVWRDFVEENKKGLKKEYRVIKSEDEVNCALDTFFLENKLIRERKKSK